MDQNSYWGDLEVAACATKDYMHDVFYHESPYLTRIDNLHKAVASRQDESIEVWTGVNLDQYFGRQILVSGNENSKSFSIFSVFPKLMVFLPILWTWLCLFEASVAFQELLRFDPSAQQIPFLTLWHQGFQGYLPGFFNFQNFTSGTVIIVGAIVSSLVLSHFSEQKLTSSIEENVEEFDFHIGELSAQLSRHRLHSPERFTSELTLAAAKIVELGSGASRTISSLELVATSSESSTRNIVEATRELSKTLSGYDKNFKQFFKVLNDIQKLQDSISQQIESLPDSINKTALASRQVLLDGLTEPISQIENYGRLSDNWMKQVIHTIGDTKVNTNANQEILEKLSRVSVDVQQYRIQLDQMKKEVATAIEQLREIMQSHQKSSLNQK